MVGTIVVVTLLLPNVNTFIPLAAVILCYGLFMTPIVPLVDNVAVFFLSKNRYNYGKLRLWGAVGYGLAALSAGALIQKAGMRFAFLGFGLLMAVGVLISIRLPSTSIPKTQTYISDLRKLFINRRWIVFLAGMFFAEFALSILMNYFIIYLYGMGGGEGLFGLSILAASISEIPFFFFSPIMLQKFKPQGVLMISCLAISIRGLVYSSIRDPRLAIAANYFTGFLFLLYGQPQSIIRVKLPLQAWGKCSGGHGCDFLRAGSGSRRPSGWFSLWRNRSDSFVPDCQWNRFYWVSIVLGIQPTYLPEGKFD